MVGISVHKESLLPLISLPPLYRVSPDPLKLLKASLYPTEKRFNGQTWERKDHIKLIGDDGKRILMINDHPYMCWMAEDKLSARIAIAQICELGMATPEELSRVFDTTIKSVDAGEVESSSGRMKNDRSFFSQAQRVYLDQLEQGGYNAYAGGLLFVPLLEKYSFLPPLGRIINIPTHEGYSLEELCLTLFYIDSFAFRSMEDFKRVYPEEFGALIGRSFSPSRFTLRRFLHKVRKLKKSEELIDEFAYEYLKSRIACFNDLEKS